MKKKLVTLSTYLTNVIKDFAISTKKNESALIEEILSDAFLPKNEVARNIITNYLYSEESENSISQTLSAIFSYNCAGTNWQALHNNLRPIVEFAKTQALYSNVIISGKEEIIPHCCEQLESVLNLIECSENNEELKWGKELLNQLRERTYEVRMINLYAMILNNWDTLSNSTYTYRLLKDMAELDYGFPVNPDTRHKLLKLITNVSNEWKD